MGTLGDVCEICNYHVTPDIKNFVVICTPPQKKSFVRSEEAHEKNSVLETPGKTTDCCTWKVYTSFYVLFCPEELWLSTAISACCWQHLSLFIIESSCQQIQWPLWVLLSHWVGDELDWSESAEGAAAQIVFLLIVSLDSFILIFPLYCSFNRE